ncbi:MAG TPA: hypothetical protein VN540_00925 [Clostridia bacterium]|nr:hypothetical protein [Clostridia bacterium]
MNRTTLYLDKQIGEEFSDLASAQVDLDDGWHELEIKAAGGLVNVSVDGTLYIVYEDEAFLGAGGVAFETLEDSHVLLKRIEIGTAEKSELSPPSVEDTTLALQQKARASFRPDETHEGDLVLDGTEVLTIENEQFLQLGNVYVNDEARLIIRNATFMLGRGSVPTVHVYINVSEQASLIIENSMVIEKNEEGAGMLIVIRNHGTMTLTDSPAEIHLLEQYGGTVEIRNSEMINEIGGLLQIIGGSTRVADSTLGALALTIPSGASLALSGLKSGAYLESWDVRDWILDAGYQLAFERVTILEDRLEPGPYERGWLFMPAADSHVLISDSELRKVFIELNGESAAFDNLKIGMPSSLRYRDIVLDGITMTGQWPFVVRDSNVTIRNSDYLFLQPSGTSNLVLVNAHMVEFIPREFYGTISFDQCTWTNAGEIIGGEDYHSAGNDFTITGSLTIGPELRVNLQWKNARVTREYAVVVTDREGRPLAGLTVSADGQSYTTDRNGEVVFRLVFDESNYNAPTRLEVAREGEVLYQQEIDFFTSTPVTITVER